MTITNDVYWNTDDETPEEDLTYIVNILNSRYREPIRSHMHLVDRLMRKIHDEIVAKNGEIERMQSHILHKFKFIERGQRALEILEGLIENE